MIKKRLFSLLLIALILLVSLPSFADNDLVISSWIVESSLLENGDLVIVEDLTFDFKSKFNGVYRDIGTDLTDGIENIELYEIVGDKESPYRFVSSADNGDSGVYLINRENNNLVLKIFSPAKSKTSKTFRLKYTVKNVAVKHVDTGELYYKFIGRENQTPVKYFSATIKLPDSNRARTKIFAHGPINGEINFVEDDLIKMEVSDVPAKSFVEARILFPETFIGESTRRGNNTFDSIVDEELSYITREEARIKQRTRNRALLERTSLTVTTIGVLLLNYVYRKLKRDPEIFSDLNTLNPEDISPAELRAFMNGGGADGRALMTTIFDLARQGYINIEEIEPKKKKNKDFLFIRTNKSPYDLLALESYVLNWLFNTIGDGSTVSTIDIEDYRKKNSSKFFSDINEWTKKVKNSLKERGYYENKPEFGILLIIMSVITMVVAIITLTFESLWGLLPVFLSTFLLIYAISIFVRKSDKGYVQYKLWQDIRKDFRNQRNLMKDYDYIPKDKTLIYALALGLPMKHLNTFRDYISDSYSPAHWSYWYFMTNKHGGSSFEDRMYSSFYGSSASTTSSSIGGGGGFSAGGGGGAGGGGAGGF
ncbi:MAG: DUF2207 domain-containing protein [Tissierellia bacterium]|nr:DUF2207 domain-containing protein [Tissierellia bacterium]